MERKVRDISIMYHTHGLISSFRIQGEVPWTYYSYGRYGYDCRVSQVTDDISSMRSCACIRQVHSSGILDQSRFWEYFICQVR